jgi:demethylmenaquinone methyltransferase / 2-methoxy-6-polyprenyl-1,4-benzoquinol methylase
MRSKTIYTSDGQPTEDREPMKIIDVAGGTGDISFLMYEEYKKQRHTNADALVEITISDINASMLGVGKDRAKQRGYDGFNWLEANAESIPEFSDASFDLYTIAFGIRNVTDRPKALREAYRLLKRGGRFMCLEFSEVKIPIFKEVYDVYSMNIIPLMGKIISNDSESYQYLAESIRKFPNQMEFSSMIRDAGFKHVTYENLSGGI